MSIVGNFSEKIQDSIAKILKTRPLAAFSILTFIFIISRLYFSIEPLLLVAVLIGAIIIFLNFRGKTDKFITVFLCISMLLGIASADGKIHRIQKLYTALDGQYVRASGTVVSIPENKKYNQIFFFDCDKIYSHNGEFEGVKLYVRCDKKYNLKYGDKLTFNARLQAADNTIEELERYYLAKGAPLVASDVTLTKKSVSEGFYRVLAKCRNYILGIGDKFFKDDAKSLFKALTSGDRSDFSKELDDNLKLSGLSHIACVSGLHISIVGMAIFNLLKKRKKAMATLFALIGVYMFTLLTGATPSAIRAAIMFTSFIIAKATLRDNDSFTALCFAAMLLSVFNPYVIFDLGFILSFLSVLGIQIFSLYFKNIFAFLPEKAADSISLTISAQLMTMPVVINMFGYISTYSVFANVVVSSFFIWVLYACFAFIATSFVPFLNIFASRICSLGLIVIAAVANFFAQLPYSGLGVTRLNPVWFIVYYTIVLMFAFRKKLSVYFIAGMLFVCALFLVVSAFV